MLRENDLSILKYLWKWKLLSTSGVWNTAGHQDHLENTYRRLRALEDTKLIKPISFSYGMCLWTLTKSGFALLQSDLPSLKSVGSASEHMVHDFWVTSFHLGDWARLAPKGISFISEQELRRLPVENLPLGTPDPEKHRSDGYWLYRNEKGSEQKLVALEVERSLKPESVYKKYFDFYDLESSISCVIWPVASLSISRRIWKVLASGMVYRPEIHHLVTTKQFTELGWDSLARNCKNSESTVLSLLNSNLIPSAFQLRSNSSFKTFLNLRKKPTISNPSTNSPISKIPY